MDTTTTKETIMQNAWDRLKKKWDEDPLQVLLVGALVATAAAKLIDSTTNARSRRTWDREVARRERMSYK
jgi:hypothetical protein